MRRLQGYIGTHVIVKKNVSTFSINSIHSNIYIFVKVASPSGTVGCMPRVLLVIYIHLLQGYIHIGTPV